MPFELPRSRTAWLGAGTLVGSRLLGLLLSILLARTLGAADYGVYAYAFAWLGVLLVFAQLGTPTLALRELTDARHHERWGLVHGIVQASQRLVLSVSILVSAAGVLVLWLWFDGLSPQRFWSTFWMLICVPFVALAGVLAASLRGLGMPTFGLVLELLMRPALVLLLALVVLFTTVEAFGPTTIVQLQLIAAVAVCAVGLVCLRWSAGSARAEPVALRQWTPSLMPLTVTSGATLIISQADIVILGLFAPTGDIGVYRVAVQLALLTAFASQLAASLLGPAVAQHRAAADMVALRALVTRAARYTGALTLPVFVVLLFIGEWLVQAVFGAQFVAAYEPLVWLMAGQLVVAIAGPMGIVMNFCGHERRNSQLLLVSCAINVVLNFILIPAYGLTGAAVATSVALSVRSLAQWVFVRQFVWERET